jgi:glycosyltransferase involved in cell wall biosynthesis
MATYNGEKYLEEQLTSIANQTLQADELVISDDGSTDETVKIARRFAETSGIETMVIEKPERLGYVRNFERALSACSCDGNIVSAGINSDEFVWGCGIALKRSWLKIAIPFIPECYARDNWINRLAIAFEARILLRQPLQYYRRHDHNASLWALSNPEQPIVEQRPAIVDAKELQK